jgi:hypothetical protein
MQPRPTLGSTPVTDWQAEHSMHGVYWAPAEQAGDHNDARLLTCSMAAAMHFCSGMHAARAGSRLSTPHAQQHQAERRKGHYLLTGLATRQADKRGIPKSKPTSPGAHTEATTAGSRGSSHMQGRTRDVAALLAGLHARFVTAPKVLARRPGLGGVGVRVRRCASGHSMTHEGGNCISSLCSC